LFKSALLFDQLEFLDDKKPRRAFQTLILNILTSITQTNVIRFNRINKEQLALKVKNYIFSS